MKQLQSRFPITEMKICGLIHGLATSPMSGVLIITAAAVYQINHKGKAQSYTSPFPLLFLFLFFTVFLLLKNFQSCLNSFGGPGWEGTDTQIITIPYNTHMPYYVRKAHKKFYGSTRGIVT